MSQEPRTIAGVFAVAEQDWDQFIEMMEDSDDNFSTWETWKIGVDNTLATLATSGVESTLVDVNLEEFAEWCKAQGLRPVGESRSKYARTIISRRDT